MRGLDDLEQPRVVDPGVGDEQLVEGRAREHRLDARVGVDLADELVVDPAAARAERSRRCSRAAGVADEHDLAPHTGGAKDVSGDQLVARAEERRSATATKIAADDVEPERREVLAGADREDERRARDEEDARDDAARALT